MEIIEALFWIVNKITIQLPRDTEFEKIVIDSLESDRDEVVVAWQLARPNCQRLQRSIVYLAMAGIISADYISLE